MQVMKELKSRRELHKLEWEELLDEAETDDEKKYGSLRLLNSGPGFRILNPGSRLPNR